jgi:hypothetical protein
MVSQVRGVDKQDCPLWGGGQLLRDRLSPGLELYVSDGDVVDDERQHHEWPVSSSRA